MKKNKKRDPLPDLFQTIDEYVKFWDTHSTADYPKAFRPVKGKVKLEHGRFYRVSLDEKLGAILKERARAQSVTLEALVNQLLQDHLRRAA